MISWDFGLYNYSFRSFKEFSHLIVGEDSKAYSEQSVGRLTLERLSNEFDKCQNYK